MIEAVNSLVSSSAVLRSAVDQVDTQRALTANPARVQEVAQPLADLPQVPYISPYIYLDTNYDKAVLQIRDSDTGDVVRQFPSEGSLEVRRLQQLRESRTTQIEQAQEQQAADRTSRVASSGLGQLSSAPASRDIITVQDVTSTPPANTSSTTPQAASAAFGGGSSSGTQARVSVLA